MIILILFLLQIKPLPSSAAGQCFITVSNTNVHGNNAVASGDCGNVKVEGYYNGSSASIIIDGADNGSVPSGTTIDTLDGPFSLIITTIVEESKPDPEPVETPDSKPDPQPATKPPTKTPVEKPDKTPKKEEVASPTNKKEDEKSTSKPEKETQLAEKPDETPEEEAEEPINEEPEEEEEEQTTYSIDELIQMMEKGEVKGKIIDDKYYIIFEDGNEKQEVTKVEAIKLGILEEEVKEEPEEISPEDDEEMEEEIQEVLVSDVKSETGKMPFFISIVGMLTVLAGGFMYFIQWRKS